MSMYELTCIDFAYPFHEIQCTPTGPCNWWHPSVKLASWHYARNIICLTCHQQHCSFHRSHPWEYVNLSERFILLPDLPLQWQNCILYILQVYWVEGTMKPLSFEQWYFMGCRGKQSPLTIKICSLYKCCSKITEGFPHWMSNCNCLDEIIQSMFVVRYFLRLQVFAFVTAFVTTSVIDLSSADSPHIYHVLYNMQKHMVWRFTSCKIPCI